MEPIIYSFDEVMGLHDDAMTNPSEEKKSLMKDIFTSEKYKVALLTNQERIQYPASYKSIMERRRNMLDTLKTHWISVK